MKVLVVNAGSSSLKAQLMETTNGEVFAKAYCQRIGINGSFMEYKTSSKQVVEAEMPTHKEAFKLFLDYLTSAEHGVISSLDEIKAIGHRVVNLGEKYNKSIVVTQEVFEDMKNYIHFAPLHNPGAMSGMKACMELMPDKTNVAVFDTAFHSTMPEEAYMYAIPYEFYENHKIRRYGAHGTSHRYIAKKCEEIFGDLTGKKIISCHIGSGSSICAIKDGKCVDTSMGYTPLAGLVMGTRSGDIDPSVIKDMMDIKGMTIDQTINMLNKESGLVGITGEYSDLRDIDANLDKPKVKLAFDMLVYSIKKYIGSYAAAMNGVDYIVFTAGVGENDELVREAVCKDMEYLGIDFDFEVNRTAPRGTIIEFTKPTSKVKVMRIPTDEEFMIAMDTADLAK
ncbi:MAG: acetate kinase [Clostridiales bacterium]|nr:acetate kinase [Clostridiales bacterium]